LSNCHKIANRQKKTFLSVRFLIFQRAKKALSKTTFNRYKTTRATRSKQYVQYTTAGWREIIEDDDYNDFGSDAGSSSSNTNNGHPARTTNNNQAGARQNFLDIGCGAGRLALSIFRKKTLKRNGIDISPGAIEVLQSRERFEKKAIVRPISEIDRFAPNSFKRLNARQQAFGLFGSSKMQKRFSKDERNLHKTRR